MSNKKLPPAALSLEALKLVAARFKLLAEPMRLRLLQALHDGELNVTQLVAASGATQANVSKHLGLLCAAGILSRRKDGLHVFYAIADRMVFDLCSLVCSGIHSDLVQKATHFQKPRLARP